MKTNPMRTKRQMLIQYLVLILYVLFFVNSLKNAVYAEHGPLYFFLAVGYVPMILGKINGLLKEHQTLVDLVQGEGKPDEAAI